MAKNRRSCMDKGLLAKCAKSQMAHKPKKHCLRRPLHLRLLKHFVGLTGSTHMNVLLPKSGRIGPLEFNGIHAQSCNLGHGGELKDRGCIERGRGSSSCGDLAFDDLDYHPRCVLLCFTSFPGSEILCNNPVTSAMHINS